MNYARLLFALIFLLHSLFMQATPLDALSPNNLPAPAWVNAIEITNNSIRIKWEPVSGADHYKVSRFDVTHGVQLPDAFPVEPEYLSMTHDPGTTISFDISPVEPNGQVGASTTADFTTTIIVVDDIVSFSAPIAPITGKSLQPGTSVSFTLIDANKNAATVAVQRTKVQFTTNPSQVFHAEFLLWSQCAIGNSNAARVMYWNEPSWPSAVDYVENHQGGSDGPITSITFTINGGPFFTIYQPSFVQGINGNPNEVKVQIRNDRTVGNLSYGQKVNVEDNPCYAQPGYQVQNPTTLFSSDDNYGLEGDEAQIGIKNTPLSISPNPFSDGFTLNYTLDTESPVALALFDYTGRQVRTMQLSTLDAGNYSTSIYTNDLPAGIYQLSFQTNQARLMTTLVKHN